ncbi:MAG: sulfur reduction protein DsrJ [Gammaproteobacteria bacterium]|nr:sulfur reduction protein DsrJ [Gammaproteobacteria bacterium]
MTPGAGSLMACLLLCWGAGALAAGSGDFVPAIPQGKGDRCVEPTEIMRRDHMRFLMHQRDETVHRGIRGAKHSLVGCIECHVQRGADGAAIPVDAEGQFCEGCHRFAAVRMDCFECHAAVPAAARASAMPRMFPLSRNEVGRRQPGVP